MKNSSEPLGLDKSVDFTLRIALHVMPAAAFPYDRRREAQIKTRRSDMSKSKATEGISYPMAMLGLVLSVGTLYLAKPVIMPLAMAVLLSFILTPLVTGVQRRGVPRVPATLGVVLSAFLLAGLIGWGVVSQVTKLANDLPDHTNQIKDKIDSLRGGGGVISKLTKMASDVGKGPATAATQPAQLDAATHPPIIVTAAPTENMNSALERILGYTGFVIEPLANGGLILVLTVFMLIRREDLRNRVIGLLGPARLTGTTRVTVEAGRRLSKFLLAQLCVNASFGVLFGLGLLIIGVQYWFLWAFLTAVLRFIPYVGTWLAALFPIVLSFATAKGFGQPITVLGFFFVLDLVTANVVEPLLFGHSTGVSPIALLIAAAFWTWIWGPVGLVLSTPLTVCMVVLGQNAPRLKALALLFGDQPALDPHMNYYQRLLAGDQYEAAQVLADYATATGPDELFDDVMVPALRLMRRDRAGGRLEIDDERFFLDTTGTLIATREVPNIPDAAQPLVLACPSHHRAEESVLRMLGLAMQSLPVRFEAVSTQSLAVEIERKVESQNPAVLVIAVLPPGGLVQARYLCHRLRSKFPGLKIIVIYLGRTKDFDRLLVRLRRSGASYVTTSILQTRSQIAALVETATAPPALVTSAGGTE